MKILPPPIKSLVISALVGVVLSGCTDNMPPPQLDPTEEFTREFVKAFGVFNAESWDQAVATGVTVHTEGVSSLKILAEIDGTRFMFADLGGFEGRRAIPINIPRNVKELILLIDGEREVKVAPGAEVNIDKGSRAISKTFYRDQIYWSNITPNLTAATDPTDSRYRRMFISKQAYADAFLTPDPDGKKDKFMINSYSNFQPRFEGAQVFHGSKYQVKGHKKYYTTVYPVYWKTNQYNENDYLVGIYFFQSSGTIEMHDLFKVQDMIKKCNSDHTNEISLSPGFDVSTFRDSEGVAVEGVHITFDNPSQEDHVYYGFYIKSGLKETENTRAANFGRDCEHITFQDFRYNSWEWGNENCWNLPLESLIYAFGGSFSSFYGVDLTKFDRMDNAVYKNPSDNVSLDTYTDAQIDKIYTKEGRYLSFTSQPNGVDGDIDTGVYTDMSDVVLLVDAYGNGASSELLSLGESYLAYPWYLAAEDLGGSEDWDFNDLIVLIYDITTDMTATFSSKNAYYPVPSVYGRRIIVEPVATGATLPVYLMYEGEVSDDADYTTNLSVLKKASTNFKKGTYVIGTEIHKWLGAGDDYTQFINVESDYTEASARGCAVSFCVPVIKNEKGEAVVFNAKTDLIKEITGQNQTMRGFWVLVDKDINTGAVNTNASILQNPDFDPTPRADHVVYGKKKVINTTNVKSAYTAFTGGKLGGAYRVDAPNNDKTMVAPQMLMCNRTWYWCRERESIDKVWGRFAGWVSGDFEEWHPSENSGSTGQGDAWYDPDKVCFRKNLPDFKQ